MTCPSRSISIASRSAMSFLCTLAATAPEGSLISMVCRMLIALPSTRKARLPCSSMIQKSSPMANIRCRTMYRTRVPPPVHRARAGDAC